MEHPGQHRADEEGENRLLADRRQQFVEQACRAQGCRGLLDEGERQQHQPKADEGATQIVRTEFRRP